MLPRIVQLSEILKARHAHFGLANRGGPKLAANKPELTGLAVLADADAASSCILAAREQGRSTCRINLIPKIADSLVMTAVSRVWALPSEKIICTRRALKEAVLAAVQEAHSIGFLAGREVRFRDSTLPGSADRPSWMDIRLDDREELVRHQLRFKPIVVRSLLAAGYHCLGDLRWLSVQQLISIFYVGRKTAYQIRAAVERLEGEG